MEFKTAYQALEKCLANYITLKKEGGWAEKVKAFQSISMPIILESEDIQYLKIKVQELANDLCSKVHWLSFGILGGSTLKADLQKLLQDIGKPAVDIPLEGDRASLDSLESPDSQAAAPPQPLCVSLESPPSCTTPPSSTSSVPPSPFSRRPSLPASPVSVTGYLPSQPPFACAYRDRQAEELIKDANERIGTFIRPSQAEQNAILGMKFE